MESMIRTFGLKELLFVEFDSTRKTFTFMLTVSAYYLLAVMCLDFNPEDLEFTHDREKREMIIRKPGAYVAREWRIDIHT
jgi:hypothetical protein